MRNGIKYYIILVALFCLSLNIHSETVSQKQAYEMAHRFFNEVAGRVVAPPKLVYNGKRLTTNRLFTPFYIYNNPMGGFVIISAENKAFPILGFSLKDNFDPELVGDSEKALLASYAREIELIRYDANYVPQADSAWINYAKYVADILSATYHATDPIFSIEEADRMLDFAVEDDSIVFSDLYTPDQWYDIIMEELQMKQSVPLWLVSGNEVFPAVVYGWQSAYFRIEMTRRNTWLMRLNATENVPANMVTTVLNPKDLPKEEEISVFSDLDTYYAELSEIENNRRNSPHIDIISKDVPYIMPQGGGHYEIVLPSGISLARIYNLEGGLVSKLTFGNTPTAYIDLSANKQGFYIVNIIDDNGMPYSFKVYR